MVLLYLMYFFNVAAKWLTYLIFFVSIFKILFPAIRNMGDNKIIAINKMS